MTGGMGPRRLIGVEKEEASIFQAADYCGCHVYRIILLTKPIIVLEVFSKNISFRSTQRAVLQKSCSTVGILLGKLIQFYVLLAK